MLTKTANIIPAKIVHIKLNRMKNILTLQNASLINKKNINNFMTAYSHQLLPFECYNFSMMLIQLID